MLGEEDGAHVGLLHHHVDDRELGVGEVLGDLLQRGGLAIAAPPHRGRTGLGVTLDVDERFLGDAPHLSLLEERESVAGIGVDPDVEFTSIHEAAGELFEHFGFTADNVAAVAKDILK